MSIRIFYDIKDFRLKGSRKIRKHIEKVIGSEEKSLGDLNFIFTGDDNLLRINKEFLNHDYLTDVITFGDSLDDIVQGEIYISVDTVRLNSFNYNVSLKEEILRVMIHGVLHLLGYDDRTEEQRARIREREDFWIKMMEE